MPKITITDNRTSKNFDKENMEISVTGTKSTTFQVLENDEVVDKVLDVVQPAEVTTLKDIDGEISNMEMSLSQSQVSIDSLKKQLTDKRGLRESAGLAVDAAYGGLAEAVGVAPERDENGEAMADEEF